MKLYRYEIDINNLVSGATIELREFDVYRETPKCYVIRENMRDKFVRKEGKSIFAYPDKKEALLNYIRRTERYIAILKDNIDRATCGLSYARNKFNKLTE